MSEQPSFWQRIFGGARGSSLNQRQERVLGYMIGRLDKHVPLQEVIREDYVRRNCSGQEVEQIVSTPEFVQAARARLGESFRSEDLKL